MKKFEKVVEWKGEYDYKEVATSLISFNIMNSIIGLAISFHLSNPWAVGGFLFWLCLNILIALSGFLDYEKKVYWKEIK